MTDENPKVAQGRQPGKDRPAQKTIQGAPVVPPAPGPHPPAGAPAEATSGAPASRAAEPAPGQTRAESQGPSQVDALVGSVLAGRYRVLRKVGEGGMGVVYEAEHVLLEKRVALKVLHPEFSFREDLRERFLREARAASRIGHENIVDITDFGTTDEGIVFFAMEFLDGMDLATLMQTHGPLPWPRARDIVLQVCSALAAAHAKGIVHRDLKPENIFLVERSGRSDFVKVVDFGIAKLLGLHDEERRLTKTGMIFGTPDYMSPEQAAGRNIDHRADIYALGVIFYEMLTGQLPFESDSFMGMLTKHMFEVPTPPSRARPDLDIPPGADAVVMKALEKKPEDRYQSMEEFAQAIREVDTIRPSQVVPLTRPKAVPAVPTSQAADLSTEVVALPPKSSSGHGKVSWVVGVLVLVGAAATAAYFVARHRGQRASSAEPAGTRPATPESEDSRTDRTRPVHGSADLEQNARPRGREPGRWDAGARARDGALPAPVLVRISSRPSHAEVLLDGQPAGTTPLTLRVEAPDKRHRLTVRKEGYLPAERVFVPEREKVLQVRLRRQRRSARRHEGRTGSRPAAPPRAEPRKPRQPRTPRPSRPGPRGEGPFKKPPGLSE